MKSACGIRGAAARAGQAIGRFGRAEDGSMIMLGLWISVLMLMLGGLAVDLMRAELRRTEVQQTADRAALAAASLSQTLDPETVVRDYFDKQGLIDTLGMIDIEEMINSKSVTVNAEVVLDPFFAQFSGIDQLTAPATSTAVERITDVEISLVLDVSGSMGSNNRLTNLKSAAKEFVDLVMASAVDGRTSISVIPYSSQVNVGAPIFDELGVPRDHAASHCIDLNSSTFSSTAINNANSLTQTGHFDPFAGTLTRTPSNWVCNTGSNNIVRPVSNDADVIKAQIDALAAKGNTSIDLGMKWGAALLDPEMKPLIAALADQGVVDAGFADRPLDPRDIEVLKIIVLMTDGENTTQYMLNDAYSRGLSPIWRRKSDGRLSVYRNRNNTSSDYYDTYSNTWLTKPLGGSDAQQLTWPQVWETASVNWVASNLYREAFGNTTSYWQSRFRSTVSDNTKEGRLGSVCNAAKAKKIIVFGIAFEAPANGQQQISQCASSAGHYFDAEGLEIRDAFRMIASQITTLKLIQ